MKNKDKKLDKEKVAIDPELLVPTSLKEIVTEFNRIYPGKIDILLVALALSISHLVDTKTPLWLILVGVPSSAKTEIVRMLSLTPNVYLLDTLTDNAFISGAMNKDGSTPNDLLPTINGKLLIVKDLTTLLSQREESVRKVIGDLTSIYDDTFSKHSPQRGTIKYSSFFSFLGCVTPQALNRHQRYMSQIGPRFLFLRIASSTEEEVAFGFNLLWQQQGFKESIENLRKKVSAYSYQLSQKIKEIKVDLENKQIQNYINNLALFISYARGTVLTRSAEFVSEDGSKVTYYEPYDIQQEEPFRALQQLKVLARSLVIVNGKANVEASELNLVKKIALSSMPADRSLLISTVAKENKGWTAKEVSEVIGISYKTTLRQLEELVFLKVLTKKTQGEGKAILFYISSKFQRIIYTDVEFMSHSDISRTQTPHLLDEHASQNKDPETAFESLTLQEQEEFVTEIFSENSPDGVTNAV